MAAQFKEVVVTAHTVEAKQGLPDRGQGRFHFALRGFVFTAGDRILSRHRQRLAGQACRSGSAARRQG
ncbi:hypothetical protein LP419_12830 [Massilia sp. H-1]|nr:hypothetical protein LP419_12830 [Massilia sp. H-1]